MGNSRWGRRGFTLVELLIVIVIIAVLAAIAIPKFSNSNLRSRESSLKSDLKVCRDAVNSFYADTSAYPASLSALSATTAPATGLDNTGAQYSITASNWHGPYLLSIPNDPISGNAFNYSTTSGSVGNVTSSASGNASDGTSYSSW
jgi:general secretion pathway protein G